MCVCIHALSWWAGVTCCSVWLGAFVVLTGRGNYWRGALTAVFQLQQGLSAHCVPAVSPFFLLSNSFFFLLPTWWMPHKILHQAFPPTSNSTSHVRKGLSFLIGMKWIFVFVLGLLLFKKINKQNHHLRCTFIWNGCLAHTARCYMHIYMCALCQRYPFSCWTNAAIATNLCFGSTANSKLCTGLSSLYLSSYHMHHFFTGIIIMYSKHGYCQYLHVSIKPDFLSYSCAASLLTALATCLPNFVEQWDVFMYVGRKADRGSEQLIYNN